MENVFYSIWIVSCYLYHKYNISHSWFQKCFSFCFMRHSSKALRNFTVSHNLIQNRYTKNVKLNWNKSWNCNSLESKSFNITSKLQWEYWVNKTSLWTTEVLSNLKYEVNISCFWNKNIRDLYVKWPKS